MGTSKNQNGFAVIEVAIIIVVVALLSFVALRVMNKDNNKTDFGTIVPQASLPVKIHTKDDVSKSIKALDGQPIDSQLDPSQLDGNISSLL